MLFTLGIDVHEEKQRLCGIDIGCGASCIFPLIGCKMYEKSRFIASDISPASVAAARRLVEENGLQDRVALRVVDTDGQIFPCATDLDQNDDDDEDDVARFTTCNPPFFSSANRARASRKRKSVFMGKGHEIWSESCAEVDFVKRMVDEGVRRKDELRDRVKVFTSMVGIKSDLFPIVAYLDSREEVTFWRVGVLRQGKTFRWCVAWAFGDIPCKCYKPMKKLELSKEAVERRLRRKEVGLSVSLEEAEIMRRVKESVKGGFKGRFRWNSKGDLVLIYAQRSAVCEKGQGTDGEAEREGEGEWGMGLGLGLRDVLFGCHVVVKKNALVLALAEELFADRKAFAEFCQRVQADVVRTNRYWRRRLKRVGSGKSGVEG